VEVSRMCPVEEAAGDQGGGLKFCVVKINFVCFKPPGERTGWTF
jgi:hypothetical protein